MVVPASSSWPAGGCDEPSSSGGPLYNADVQTAIGLGDELASIVDRFGQVKSRKAAVNVELGSPPRPISAAECSQSLEGGYSTSTWRRCPRDLLPPRRS